MFKRTIYALGGGEWSVELHDDEGNFIKEFTGSNGTHSPADDLHEEADQWEEKFAVVEATQTVFPRYINPNEEDLSFDY